MKKFGIALAISVIVVLTLPSLGLAAFRWDPAGVFGTSHDGSLVTERGGDPRIVFINEKLYPDTMTTAPIDDENVSLPYAFSSGSLPVVVDDEAENALCDADCQDYAAFVQWCMDAACMLP